MGVPAHERHEVVATLSSDERRWLESYAARLGVTVSEALAALVRAAHAKDALQGAARSRLLDYLGDAATLEPGEEEEILREMRGDE